MKRVFSFLLVLLLVVGLLPVQAMAETSGEYNVYLDIKGEGGNASVSSATAAYGETVTVSVTTDSGIEMKNLFATYYNPDETIIWIDNYTKEFQMPAADVTITVEFGGAGDSDSDYGECYVTYRYCDVDIGGFPVGEPYYSETVAPGSTYQFHPLDSYTIAWIEVLAPPVTPDNDHRVTVPVGGISAIIYLTKDGGEGGSTPQPTNHSIKLTPPDHGTVEVPAQAAKEQTVTVIPTPDPDYRMKEVKVTDENGESIDVDGNTFVMPDCEVTVEVIFEPIPSYDVTVNDPEHGTAAAPEEAKVGSPVTVTVTPDEGYMVDTVTRTNGPGNPPVDVPGDGKTFQFPMPEHDVEITVTIKEKPSYPVKVTEPQNGTVVPSETSAKEGKEVTVTAAPDENYAVGTITVKDADGTEIPVADNKFTMPDSEVTITVTFERVYKITVDNPYPDRGTVTIEPNPAKKDEPVKINPVPKPGFEVKDIIVTGGNNPIDVSDDNTFTMPEGEVTVKVIFDEAIKIIFDHHNGSASQDFSIVKGGSMDSLPETSNGDYYFTGWYSQEKGGSRVDTNTKFDTPTTVHAHWIKATHTTNASANAFTTGITTPSKKVTDAAIFDQDLFHDKDIEVYLKATRIDDSVSSTAKNAIAAGADGRIIAAYLDLTLYKTFVGLDNSTQTVPSPKEALDITMTIPAELIPAGASSDSFTLIHYSGGTAEVIPAHFNTASRVLSFQAAGFSPYALAYTQTTRTSAGVLDNVPKTGDSSALLNWTLLVLCSAAMLAGVAILDRKRAR